MEQTVVSASTGRTLGTRSSKRLRREGQLPGVVYGLGKDPVNVEVTYIELRDALKTEAGLNTVFTLEIQGGESEMVLVRDVQRHPIRRDVIHADFLRVDPRQTITLEIPIVLVGVPNEDIAAASAIIEQSEYTLTVECSPQNIPDSLEVDQSLISLDRSLTLADITLPAGVETRAEPDLAIASAVITRAALAEDEEGVEGEEGEEGEEGVEGEEGADGEASAEGDSDAGGDE